MQRVDTTAEQNGSGSGKVYRRYLFTLLIAFGGLCATSIGANYFLKSREGTPAKWTPHVDYFRVDYFNDVRARKPDLVIVGSSRMDAYRSHPFGDPRAVPLVKSEFDWGDDISNYAVLTLYNASTTEIERAVKASHAVEYARTLFVGLDFFAANAFFSISAKYPVDALRYYRILLEGYVSAQNFITRIVERFNFATTKYVPPTGELGDAMLATSRYFRKLFENSSEINSLTYPLTSYSPAREAIRALLAEVERGNTQQVYLVITPVHAWALEAIDAAGLWPTMEAWKRMLVIEVDRFNTKTMPAKHVELWDFGGHHCVATEPMRVASARRLWADIDHHKPVVSRAIIAKLREHDLPPPVLPGCDWEGFGVRMTGENIETHLERLRQLKDSFQQTRRTDVETVAAIFARLERQSFRRKLF